MKEIILGLLTLCCATAACEAAPLTLACNGTATTIYLSKGGAGSEPEKETINDFSVVVDLDKKFVTGFRKRKDGSALPSPIVAASPNDVTFKYSEEGLNDTTLEGTVDRITGKIDVVENHLYKNGTMMMITWDFRCKPAKPLF